MACVQLKEILSHVWEIISTLGSMLASTFPKKVKEHLA